MVSQSTGSSMVCSTFCLGSNKTPIPIYMGGRPSYMAGDHTCCIRGNDLPWWVPAITMTTLPSPWLPGKGLNGDLAWVGTEGASVVQCGDNVLPFGDSHMLFPWWRHQMETFSALLAICAGNSPVPGEFPAQRPVTWSFMFSLICAWINGWANNREAWIFET